MPTGIIINALALALGGIIGTLLGRFLTQEYKDKLSVVFAICSLGMGVNSIILLKNLAAVILALILGTFLGILIKLQKGIQKGALLLQKPLALLGKGQDTPQDAARQEFLLIVIVVFCASGSGIYGSIDAGLTGDHSILIAKSVLDFFAAIVFACQLGAVTSLIAIPQFLLFLLLFTGARFLSFTPDMLADFKACGGFIILAAGLRMLKIGDVPAPEMIPAMALVMPLSRFWTEVVLPFLFG